MKRLRQSALIFYAAIVGGFVLLTWWVLEAGKSLEIGRVLRQAMPLSQQTFFSDILHNLRHPLSILFLQIVAIIVISRVFGFFLSKIGQPVVIGEILAGIALGPSLLGWLLPGVSGFLFPHASLANLHFLSQLGLVLFMFVVGLELDIKSLKNKAHNAVIISHASIIIPFFLGVALSYFLYREFAPHHIPFAAFSLFMGIAMSITAFPVLARIVQERGLSKKPLGILVITCAAADDVTAWCILAGVIAIVKAGAIKPAIATILISLVYLLGMFYVVKPLMKKIGRRYENREVLSRQVVALALVTLVMSAWITEVIGIHALFGAFLAGVVMADSLSYKNKLIEKIEDVALVLLLPLFFGFSGLRTQIGLLNTYYAWAVCFAITGVAILGKLGGSSIAAKVVGQSWKDSLSIGVLMNARGLIELVVLNIAYDLGVIGSGMFAMLVLMALFTTLMTGPALDLIQRLFPKDPPTVAPL
jgi:Kef-type K+ transport system membrane component KefB